MAPPWPGWWRSSGLQPRMTARRCERRSHAAVGRREEPSDADHRSTKNSNKGKVMFSYSSRLAENRHGRRHSLITIGCLTAIVLCCTALLASQAQAEPECWGWECATYVSEHNVQQLPEVTVTGTASGILEFPEVTITGKRPVVLPPVSWDRFSLVEPPVFLFPPMTPAERSAADKARIDVCFSASASDLKRCQDRSTLACDVTTATVGILIDTACKTIKVPILVQACLAGRASTGDWSAAKCTQVMDDKCTSTWFQDMKACGAPPTTAPPAPSSPIRRLPGPPRMVP
jgi:hypothetical protein